MKLFRYGIEICDLKQPQYGGHWQWLARWLNIDYLSFSFEKWKTGQFHGYYDGFHHCRYFGFVWVAWGGRPYKYDDKF